MKLPLFPRQLHIPGLILLIIGIISGLILDRGLVPDSIRFEKLDEVICLTIIAGGFFAGFSKRKDEDETIQFMRLFALMWSVYFCFVMLVLAIIFLDMWDFFRAMAYNMFSILIINVALFQFLIFRVNTKIKTYEKRSEG